MQIEVSGPIWFWRGPAPWHFVTVPDEPSGRVRAIASGVSYGWGMIPAVVRIGAVEWSTALWPKDGRYIVPIRTDVRRVLQLEEGDEVTLHLRIGS